MRCPICEPSDSCPVYPHALAKIVADPVGLRRFHDRIIEEMTAATPPTGQPTPPAASNAHSPPFIPAPPSLPAIAAPISLPPARSYSLLPLVHACEYRKKDEGCGCNGSICTFYSARKSTSECLACMDGGGPKASG